MHSSRASATSQWIGDLEMMTSLALDPSRLRRRRPSLVTASQSRLLTHQVIDGKPQPRFSDQTFVSFMLTYFLFQGTSYLRWNTFACLQIVAEIDTRSRIEGQLWISFCKSFQCNVMIWFNIFLLKVRISATTPVGDLEAEVAVHKENFIHGFSLHQVPNCLLYLSWHLYIYWESHKWIMGQHPIKKISIVFFFKSCNLNPVTPSPNQLPSPPVVRKEAGPRSWGNGGRWAWTIL